MAKKNVSKDPSYHKLKADYYPVQRSFTLSSSGSGDYLVGDAGSLLSRVNFRLMRQGKCYSMKLDLNPNAPIGTYEVYALVDTWYIQKAWQMARATYLKATADERKQLGNETARWEDFRVNAGLTLANQQVAHPSLYTQSGAGAALTAGERPASKVYLESTGALVTFGFGNTSANEFGIVAEYDKVGRSHTDPESPTTQAAYSGVDAEVDGNQQNALMDDGNKPPYAESSFGNLRWVRVAQLRNDSPSVSKLSTGFFNAPCGLFYVKPPSTGFTFGNDLTFTVQAGDYKGVKAHNMGV